MIGKGVFMPEHPWIDKKIIKTGNKNIVLRPIIFPLSNRESLNCEPVYLIYLDREV